MTELQAEANSIYLNRLNSYKSIREAAEAAIDYLDAFDSEEARLEQEHYSNLISYIG